MGYIIQDIAFVLVFGTALYLFFSAVFERYRFLKLAAPDPTRFENPGKRFRSFVVNVLGQRKVLAEPSGLGHFFIFWGFLFLVFGDLDFISFHLFHWSFPWATSPVYLFIEEMFSWFVLVAIVVGLIRRYILKPMRVEQTFEAGLILGLIGTIVLTYFFATGADMAYAGSTGGWYSPIVSLIARWFHNVSKPGLLAISDICFWIHILAISTFLYFIPRSKHVHMIGAMFNWYFRRYEPVGKLRKLDLEDESIEEFGVGQIQQFTWKQLLDGYACTECGRCHVSCPATLSGKSLSPKHLILKMKEAIVAEGPGMLAQMAAGAENITSAPVFEGVFTEDEVWACTTCRACEEACPVANEHVQDIIDLRRHLVLTEGKTSPEVTKVFSNLERQSNEWGIHRRERAAWVGDLPVRTMAEVEGKVEYLYFVGTAASYDQRSQKIAQAFAKVLLAAGVDFAILGTEEESDGDSARRLGNEFLYQEFVQKNIEVFQEYGVKKIITTDPHAFNTFKNEYPDFGFTAEVYHSTQFAAKLISEGKLKPQKRIEKTITYHDSCYLGRYNDVYDPPRFILESIPGVRLVEMERSRNKSMCCGAGGGGMFKEEGGAARINVMRAEQALQTGAEIVGTACPYCMTMLIDGTKANGAEERLETFDVIELLSQSIA
ncbi:MAG: heterodisulfide reductase-related iron-sulfur binding cluster [Alicyclobacillaceae bacterium]|uniref:heterodisulfide reductase-related iron-sulfur binding cluster n=1 Tax=Alicyclobacillus sp. SP_1 TaxID=2942475 RepID=UPI0021575A47|nr:heterodisulfide reductase-related iron-sulfur binding cluster [Alicyclobacillus sp. SP_1]MCY0888666.1 heterodisulfide reductase-related iron-sulfur binding cluster [Alicyclobacillaceae bacterium]MCY0894917.1 heterodisulfide reductase-related iron-sulfur binding cluster [Alicyclobacillaceae bacterium]